MAGAAGRAVSSGRSRGLITVDRAIALVDLATDGPLFEPGNVWRLTRPFGDQR